MSSTTSPTFGPSSIGHARGGSPPPLAALLAAARMATSAAGPRPAPPVAAAVSAPPPHYPPRAALPVPAPVIAVTTGAVAARQTGTRANKIGLFGMVSEECLEQIRRHVEPINGLHAWTAQAIYTALAVCASKQGSASAGDGQRCWVTVAEVAARTGMGRRNVERYLPVLRNAGVLRIVHTHDALHRPTASHYVFVYSHTEERDTPTPESVSPAAPVAETASGATPESARLDSGVGTVVKSQENPKESGPERADFFEGQERTNENASPTPAPALIPSTTAPPPPPAPESVSECDVPEVDADDPWTQAQRRLAAEVTPAAYSAWLRPLVLVPSADGLADGPMDRTAVDGAPRRVVLGCGSPFHHDQMERRYRAVIEAAVEGPVEFVLLGTGGGG